MKKFFSILAMGVLALSALVACNKEDVNKTVAVTGIKLSQTTLNLVAGGETATLKVSYLPQNATEKPAVTWTSSNPEVAAVAAGVVNPLAQGTAEITAKAGKFEAKCVVTVAAAPIPATGIEISATALTLTVGGEPVTLTATLVPAETTEQPAFTWTSSDSEVASVADGVVTPVAEGTATITVAQGELKATCEVKVEAAGAEVPTNDAAPDMASNYIPATFPGEAIYDAVTYEGWVNAREVSSGLKTFMGVENMFLVRWEGSKLMIVGGKNLQDNLTLQGEYKYTWNDTYPLNSWHHIAATYVKGGETKLYVDGDEVASGAAPDHAVYLNGTGGDDNCPLGSRSFFIGAAYDTRYFNGFMSHLRVWNKALTNEEIIASANNKTLAKADGLIANWPMNEGEGNEIKDYSGNNITATAHGDLTWTTGVVLPDIVKATAVSFAEPTLTLTRGEEKALTVNLTPANALLPNFTWETSDDKVARAANGIVTALGVGTATITAKATVLGQELSASCEVTVEPLTGAVAPSMKENYFEVPSGLGTFDAVTVEWKMRANSFDAPQVSSVFGVEGKWLLRIGDQGIGLNELQLATNHGNWTTGVTFEADTWYHVAVTYNTADKKAEVYVNSQLVATNEEFATQAAALAAGGSSWNPTRVLLGASYLDGNSWSGYRNNRWFDGEICEVRVWDTVRSAAEIKANMNNFEGTSDNLKAYWKMDLTDANNGDGNTIKDYSASGKDMTAKSTPLIWKQGRPDVKPQGPIVFDASNAATYTHVTFGGDDLLGLSQYTFEVRMYAKTWQKSKNGWSRRPFQICNASEKNGAMFRFGDGSSKAGVVQFCGIGGGSYVTSHPFEAGKWITFTMVGDGTNLKLYDNGEEIFSKASSATLDANTFELGMSWDDGSKYPEGQAFQGYFSYIRLWNVARTQEQIKAGLESVPNDSEGLVANWILNTKGSGKFIDATGKGHDMDFSKTWREGRGDADGNNVDVSELIKGQWVEFSED